MSELRLSGVIKQIGELQKFDSGFQKVQFVITTDDEYPQDVALEFFKDKADNFIKYHKVGDDVDVKFNVLGNEYKGRHYVSLNAWWIEKLAESNNEEVTDDLPEFMKD